MSLDTVIMLLGGFVAVLPFLGFPNSWDDIFFFIAGIVVIICGIIVRRRSSHHETPVENHGAPSSISNDIRPHA